MARGLQLQLRSDSKTIVTVVKVDNRLKSGCKVRLFDSPTLWTVEAVYPVSGFVSEDQWLAAYDYCGFGR